MTESVQGGPLEFTASSGSNVCPVHHIERNRADLITAGGCRKCHEENLEKEDRRRLSCTAVN